MAGGPESCRSSEETRRPVSVPIEGGGSIAKLGGDVPQLDGTNTTRFRPTDLKQSSKTSTAMASDWMGTDIRPVTSANAFWAAEDRRGVAST